MRISDWSSHVCSSDLDGESAGSELPTTFGDLRVRMLIEGERLNIDGNWRAGEQGRGTLAGSLDWRNELDLDLAIKGSRLPVVVEPYADLEVEPDLRSEERRGGKECVSTCRSRWSQCT